MSVLALDLATKVGWAHSSGTSGVYELPGRDSTGNGIRFNRFQEWLNDMVDGIRIDTVVYEMAHHRGGHATRLINGLIAVIEMQCDYWDISCKGYHSALIKKHATGKGNAKKPEMYEAALKRNPDRRFITDDEVDALWLLDLALSEL